MHSREETNTVSNALRLQLCVCVVSPPFPVFLVLSMPALFGLRRGECRQCQQEAQPPALGRGTTRAGPCRQHQHILQEVPSCLAQPQARCFHLKGDPCSGVLAAVPRETLPHASEIEVVKPDALLNYTYWLC